ncbi:hypothetical protein [Pseudomonas syringae]|uniref:hypothetical protein n=1 Tax=Pseudomonas syringae TaxID=317 RepID=UPI001F1D5B72|nr:hypothetical protein [Pseudomonas syringae]
MQFGMRCQHAESAMKFLVSIGLPVQVEAGACSFIEHVAVFEGGLRVDSQAHASGLLHEAGHLAVMPARFRHFLSGNLSEGMSRAFAELDQLGLEPDDPLMRAMLQTSDPEVTAWAWAAGKAIGLPDEMIIEDDDYQGEGEAIRISLAANAYVGIYGLSHAGFCVVRRNPYRPLPVYPELAQWLQQ